MYDLTLPTKLETDASQAAIGACLSQLYENQWHPVTYLSKKFTKTEQRYSTPDQELMAIVEACRI